MSNVFLQSSSSCATHSSPLGSPSYATNCSTVAYDHCRLPCKQSKENTSNLGDQCIYESQEYEQHQQQRKQSQFYASPTVEFSQFHNSQAPHSQLSQHFSDRIGKVVSNNQYPSQSTRQTSCTFQARKPQNRDAFVSQRYTFSVDSTDGNRKSNYIEVTLMVTENLSLKSVNVDQTPTNPSLMLRVTTDYAIDNLTWNQRKTVPFSSMWVPSSNSLRGELGGLLTSGGGNHQFCCTSHVYLHWGLGYENIHDWEIPRRPLRDRFSSAHHQIAEDASAVRSVLKCSSFDPSTSRSANRNRSLTQMTDLISVPSSEDSSTRTSFCRNLSQYVLTQSAITNAECRELYYQRLAIDGCSRSAEVLKQQLQPKSLEVLIPIGEITNSPAGFQFVLHDTKRNLWIRPDHSFQPHPIFHFSSSGDKILSPALWDEPSTSHGNFLFPIYRALRILSLLRFRAFVSLMHPPPSIYRQFDLRPQISSSLDVGVWNACLLENSGIDQAAGGTASFVIVELVTNIDKNAYSRNGGNEALFLHWGVIHNTPMFYRYSCCYGGMNANRFANSNKFEWEIPNLCCWPHNTKEAFRGRGRQGALETVLGSGKLYGEEFSMLLRTRLIFPIAQVPSGIAFVLKNSSEVSSASEGSLQSTIWIKHHNEDFIVMFSAELKAGTSRYRLIMPPSSDSLFSTQSLKQPHSGNSADSVNESPLEDSNAHATALTQTACRLRRNVFAAGAAVALKMAQSGQLKELSTAAAGRRLSATYRRPSLPFCIDSPPRSLANAYRNEALSGNAESGGENISNHLRSRRFIYEPIVAGIGQLSIQFGSFHNEKGKVALAVTCRSPIQLTIHWAFANMNTNAGSSWVVPAKQFWPPSTILAGSCAVETPLRCSSIHDNLWTFELRLPLYVELRTHQSSTSNPYWRSAGGSANHPTRSQYRQTVNCSRRACLATLNFTPELQPTRVGTVTDGIKNRSHKLRSGFTNKTQSSASPSLSTSSLSKTSGSIVSCTRLFTFRGKGRMSKHWEELALGWGFLHLENRNSSKTGFASRGGDHKAEDCNGIYFVLTDSNHTFWIKEGNNDFFLPLRLIDYSLTSRFRWSSPERRLVESILTMELTYSSAGLHSRYHLLRNLLQDDDYDKSDSTFWSWIFIWFSFFPSSPYQFFPAFAPKSPPTSTSSKLSLQSPSLLPMESEDFMGSSAVDNNNLFFFKESVETHLSFNNRNSQMDPPMSLPKETPFQPAVLAEQADQLSLMLTSYWRDFPDQRFYIRLILARLILPSSAASISVRFENLISRWSLNLQPFFNSWYDKMRTACGPEDLIICRAWLAMLRSGDMNDFWKVLSFFSINLKTVSRDHPIIGYPVYTFLKNEELITAPTLMEVNAETGSIIKPYQNKCKNQTPQQKRTQSDRTQQLKQQSQQLQQQSQQLQKQPQQLLLQLQKLQQLQQLQLQQPQRPPQQLQKLQPANQQLQPQQQQALPVQQDGQSFNGHTRVICSTGSEPFQTYASEARISNEGGSLFLYDEAPPHKSFQPKSSGLSKDLGSASEFQVSDKASISRIIEKVIPTVENSQAASDRDATSSLHLSHSAWMAAATEANNDRFSFSNDDLAGNSSANQNGLQALTNIVCGRRKGLRTPVFTENSSDKASRPSTTARLVCEERQQTADENATVGFELSNESLLWDSQNATIENAISDEPSYCEPNSGRSSVYGGLCDQFVFESDQTRANDNTSNIQQEKNIESEGERVKKITPSNVEKQVSCNENTSVNQTDIQHTSNGVETNSSPVWIIQFYPLSHKSMFLRDVCNFIQLLEALFEPPSLSASAYAARCSLRSDVREVLNEILSYIETITDVQFFNVSNARHLLFPVIQHATDNQTLRDCMLLDIALERLQSNLTLAFLSDVFRCSPNYCQQKKTLNNGLCESPQIFSQCFLKLSHCPSHKKGDEKISASIPRQESFDLFHEGLSDCVRHDSCDSYSTSKNRTADISPLAVPQSPLHNPFVDFSLGTNTLINPIYLCKEMLACLISSLLMMRVKFKDANSIYSDFCELLVVPTPKWGYGFPVYESISKLREKTLLNASVQHTQFVRGFYQTQAQKKLIKASRHFPSPPRPSSTPFIIFPTIKLSTSDVAAADGNSSLSLYAVENGDAENSYISGISTPYSSNYTLLSVRPRFVSDPSSIHSLQNSTSIQRQSSGVGCASGDGNSVKSDLHSKPIPASELCSRLAGLQLLKAQVDKNAQLRTVLLFMNSICKNLDQNLDSILGTLQENLTAKAEQLSCLRYLVNCSSKASNDPHSSSMYKRALRTFDLADNNKANLYWSFDSHVLERIYLESPCNPIIHLLDVTRSYLSFLLDPTPPTWRIYGHSIARRIGVLKWSDSIAAASNLYISGHTPVILVVPNVTGYEEIPEDICAILFMGQPSLFDHKNNTSALIAPCSFSPLVLRARKRKILLACCLSADIFSAISRARRDWDGLLTEVVVDLSRSKIKLKLDSQSAENTCYNGEIDHQSSLFRSDSTGINLNHSNPSDGFAESLSLAELRVLSSSFHGTLGSLYALGIAEPPVAGGSQVPLSLSPPFYSYIIDAGRHGSSNGMRKISDALSANDSAWLVEVEDFWLEGLGNQAMVFKSLNSRFELADFLAPTIGVCFNGLDRALCSPENLEKASRLGRLCLELETLGPGRFIEAQSRANELLRKCRTIILTLAPPLDFLLEFQEDQKIASICRKSKKSSVLRRFGNSGALDLWRSLLMVWSGSFNLGVQHAAAANGITTSSIRTSVLIQDIRSVDYSFVLHCSIPLRFLHRKITSRSKLAFALSSGAIDQLPTFSSLKFPTASPVSASFSFDTNDEIENGEATENRFKNSPTVDADFPPHKMGKSSVTAHENEIEERRLMAFSQYWDAVSHTPLTTLSAYECPVTRNTPVSVVYGEISSGIRLRRSEILSQGRPLSGHPYSFVACQSCSCVSHIAKSSDAVSDSQSFHHKPKRCRAMTSSDVYEPTEGQTKVPLDKVCEKCLKHTSPLPGLNPSRNSCFHHFNCEGRSASITESYRSFTRQQRRSAESNKQILIGRRSSNLESCEARSPSIFCPFVQSWHYPELIVNSARPGRQSLSLPDRTMSVKFRNRSGNLICRPCLNLDSLILSDDLPGGSLVVATSHLRFGIHSSSSSSAASSSSSINNLLSNGIEPLIVNESWRNHLIDRLTLLTDALLQSQTQHPATSLTKSSSIVSSSLCRKSAEGPWIVEGVVSNGGRLLVTSYRPAIPHLTEHKFMFNYGSSQQN